MSKLEVSIKFKDNSNQISFDLTTNNVFYGNNGKGKTRILKAIELLYGLAKTMDYNSLISQLNELNLSELKINKKNYSQLFSKYDENTKNDRNRFSEFIQENKQLIYHLKKFLLSINVEFSFDTNVYFVKNKIENSVIKLTNLVNNPENYSIELLEDLISSINDTLINYQLTQDQELFYKYKRNYLNIKESEINNLLHYILQKTQDFKFNVKKHDIAIRNDLEKEKEKVLNELGKNGARYLTVNPFIESEKIFKEINNIFRKINDDHISDVWSDNQYIKSSNEKISSCKEKFLLFNKIISNYNQSIKASYDHNGNISFKKNELDIDFNKLSSGEKRLCIIFLNIIFAEEDIILIDEPEISLSLDYQNKIIRDIMSIAHNKKVMIATHAPYIYEDFIAYPENRKVGV